MAEKKKPRFTKQQIVKSARYKDQPDLVNALLQAEQAFFKALENHLALVRFLADTEVACVSPAARYYLTFSLIDYRKQPNQQPLRSLAGLLESIGGESEK